MPEYQGADVILVLVNSLLQTLRSRKHALLYRDSGRKMSFDSVKEDAVFVSILRTEYEDYFLKAYALPRRPDLKMWSNEEIQNQRTLPAKDQFEESQHEYPKMDSSRTLRCDCDDGSIACPNCRASRNVTCPECYKPRSGDCSGCRGKGELTHSVCHGSGRCRDCKGSGTIRCEGCSGTGYENTLEEVTKPCPICHGTGQFYDYECSFCSGTGTHSEFEHRTVPHPTCDGTGYLECDDCDGTGKCPGCQGRGLVECTACRGTGKCTFCSGYGTKTCPTCDGDGKATCPTCEGQKSLFLYASDVFEYKPEANRYTALPLSVDCSSRDLKFEDPGSTMITLSAISEDDIEQKLGLINPHLRATLFDAKAGFEKLLAKTNDQEFSSTAPSDHRYQMSCHKQVMQSLKHSWEKQKSDNYNSKFRLKIEKRERVLSHDKVYRKILFQAFQHYAQPVSEVELRLGSKSIPVFCQGSKQRYEFVTPTPPLDPLKILILLVTFGLASPFVIHRSLARCSKKLVTIVGDDEAAKLEIHRVLAVLASKKHLGDVRGRVLTEISQCLMHPAKYRMGMSLCYSIDVEKQEVMVLNVSSASFRHGDDYVKSILRMSDLVYCVFRNSASVRLLAEIRSSIVHESSRPPRVLLVEMGDVDAQGLPPEARSFSHLKLEPSKVRTYEMDHIDVDNLFTSLVQPIVELVFKAKHEN